MAGVALVFFATTLYLLNRPWNVSRLARQLTGILVSFYGGLLFGAFVQRLAGAPPNSVSQMIIAALSFQGATLVLISLFIRNHEVSWTEAFGLKHNLGRAIPLGLIVACLFLPIGWALQQLSGIV